MSTTEEQIVSTEQTPAPAAPVAPAETPAAPDPKDRVAVLRAAFNTPKTERGKHAAFQPREQGKFAPGAPQVPAPEAAPRPEFPTTLKKELKAHWDAAPPELLAAFMERETHARKGVELVQSKAAQADELLNEFKPYETLLRAENATPKAAIGQLLQTAAILRQGTPLQKAQAVATTMRQFGIPLEHIQQMLGNGPASPQPALDPQYNALAQQVQQTHQKLTQWETQQQQEKDRQALAVITKFASDPAYPHFEAAQERILQLLQAPQVLGDTSALTPEAKLKVAYDMAIRLDPALFAQVQAAQQVSQQTPQQVAKSRQAAVLVRGAPASGPAPKIDPKDRRAFLANELKRVR